MLLGDSFHKGSCPVSEKVVVKNNISILRQQSTTIGPNSTPVRYRVMYQVLLEVAKSREQRGVGTTSSYVFQAMVMGTTLTK